MLELLEEIAAENSYVCSPTIRQLAEATQDYIALQRKVNELRAYLLTDKFFSPNDYVNVRDVLNRLA